MPRLHRIAFTAALLFVPAFAVNLHGQSAGIAVQGTQQLTIDEPLDEVMVAGISRFVLRQIQASPGARSLYWAWDYSSPQAYDKSVTANRARFRTIVGAVDSREAANGFEIFATFGSDGVVASADLFDVYAVRWPVLQE